MRRKFKDGEAPQVIDREAAKFHEEFSGNLFFWTLLAFIFLAIGYAACNETDEDENTYVVAPLNRKSSIEVIFSPMKTNKDTVLFRTFRFVHLNNHAVHSKSSVDTLIVPLADTNNPMDVFLTLQNKEK